ncbi:MAG: Tol-Pal system protein TolB [Acetobacteraceae bacterium]|nr:Tol-Pal system protein TolB [Acetobacteraceae bacterium]
MILLPTSEVRRRDLILNALGSAALLAAPMPVLAQDTGRSAVIDVSNARNAPIPIAVADLGGGPLGANISLIVASDLARSGLFRPLDRAAFIQGGASDGGTPNFENWKPTGAQALVTGLAFDDGTQVRVEFRLWDVLPGTQIQGTAFTAPRANWRRVAHIMADAIYLRLLGEKGYFDTRIVYVSSEGPKERRVRRLAIMDQDSQNQRFLTDGAWLALTPRFNPKRDDIVYMSYANNQPRVYVLNVATGAQSSLGRFDTMTLSPRWSPDGGTVVMAAANGGGSDVIAVTGGATRRLTNSGAIDVSPCYSPDGNRIVFASDRGGDQQIYLMSANGGAAQRISYGSGRYGTPVWSPRGDLIAFTRYAGDTSNFAIGVMRPDGSGERILADGWLVEGPTFAPNGRVLMFWRETRGDARGAGFSARLYSIDVTGFNEQAVATPADATDPAWSPLGI